MAYDPDNIFAKILRGDIPCNKVFEDEHTLAFHDVAPQRPVHILVIPKGPYRSLNEFCKEATEAEIVALMRTLNIVAETVGIEASGYRVLSNVGVDGGQEVSHLHFHLFGGGPVGPMVVKR